MTRLEELQAEAARRGLAIPGTGGNQRLQALQAEAQRRGLPMTHDGFPARKNPDGSYSTEVSVTVTNPNLNEGRPTNIPSLWEGREVSEDEAVERALKSGRQFQSFGTVEDAVNAARQRSSDKGMQIDAPPQSMATPPQEIAPPAPEELSFQQRMQQAMQEVDQLPPVMQPREGAGGLLMDMAGSTGGEVAGALGGARLGGMMGSAGGPIGALVGGAIGAGTGLYASRKAQGKDVSRRELITEFGLTAAFGAPGRILNPIIRRGMSRSRFGVEVGKREAGKMVRGELLESLEHPVKEQLDQMFDMVRASGNALSPSSMKAGISRFSKDQFDDVMRAVSHIGSKPNDDFFGLGDDAVREFTALRNGKPVAVFDLGKLTHIRSQLNKVLSRMSKESDVKSSIETFVNVIDDSIDHGRYVKGDSSLLKEARAGWARLKDFQSIQNLFRHRGITRSGGGGGKHVRINFDNFVEAIDNPTTKLEKEVSEALRRHPDWKQQISMFAERLKTVDISDSPTGRFQVVDLLAFLPFAERGVKTRFYQIMAGNSGKISATELSTLANLARRSMMYQPEKEQSAAPNVVY